MSGRLVCVDRWNPQREIIEEAGSLLRRGGLVAFPTETVYGLGANGLDPSAVERIFEAKGRPSDNPLILHVASSETVHSLAVTDERALLLMEAFWPGPLTLVLRSRSSVPDVTRGGLDTVALRMPSHPVALALISASGVPVAAPSANRSGRPSPTEASVVLGDLGEGVDLVLDGGSTEVGVESTVLDVSDSMPVLLRPGGIPLEALEEVLGRVSLPEGTLALRRSPGMRYRHYAPSVPVRLWPETGPWPVVDSELSVGYMGLRREAVTVAYRIHFDSPEHYAAGLFSGLRYLEEAGVDVIVADFPGTGGIALAIRDRLSRASGLQ